MPYAFPLPTVVFGMWWDARVFGPWETSACSFAILGMHEDFY